MNDRMIFLMSIERLTVSLPEESLSFIEKYKEANQLASKSQVVQKALSLLEQQALFDMFTEMGENLEKDAETAVETSQLAAETFLDETW